MVKNEVLGAKGVKFRDIGIKKIGGENKKLYFCAADYLSNEIKPWRHGSHLALAAV